MKIDRTHFLVLAGAIATASGCFIKEADDDGQNTGGDPGTTSGGGEDGGSGGAGGAGGSGGGEAGSGAGTNCDDEVGQTVMCSGADGTACGLFAVDACDASNTAFKPKVAEAAATCITNLAATADCDAVYQCRADALNAACADPTADALCATLIDTCNTAGMPTTEQECHSYVDGLNTFGRDYMSTQCDCQFGIYSCIEGVGF